MQLGMSGEYLGPDSAGIAVIRGPTSHGGSEVYKNGHHQFRSGARLMTWMRHKGDTAAALYFNTRKKM